MPAGIMTQVTQHLNFSPIRRLRTSLRRSFSSTDRHQCGAISADHQKMHDDSDVIQASTPGNIRLPRLWANRKDMKKHTYSDRFSTTCRNNSTMSSSGTTSHSHAYVHHTNLLQSGDQSGDSIRERPDSYSKTCLISLSTRARPKRPPVQVVKHANPALYTWTSEKAYSSIKKQNICSYIWVTKKW